MAKPSKMGRITRNITTVPWLVNSSLYSCGLTRLFSGTASCMRITKESKLPPSRRKKKPVSSSRVPILSFWTPVSCPRRPGGSAHSRLSSSPVSGSATEGVSRPGPGTSRSATALSHPGGEPLL